MSISSWVQQARAARLLASARASGNATSQHPPHEEPSAMPTHRRVTFAQDVVDDLRKMLREAPEPSTEKPAEYSKLALVRDLAPELRTLARRGWSWKALAAMMSPRVAISPELLQSYVRGRSHALRRGKTEKGVAPTSRDRPGARKPDSASGTSRPLPRPAAPPARANAALGEQLVAEEAWGADEDLEEVREDGAPRTAP
jgi:hypothetical protein